MHTDAASRPYTDQSGILHENAMEKELSAELKKKLKKVQKTCEVSPIAVFWLICVTDNRVLCWMKYDHFHKTYWIYENKPFCANQQKVGRLL